VEAEDPIVPALTRLYRDGDTPVSLMLMKTVSEQVTASQR
jgi:hypothetical protein